ncbi:MAG TPA: methyltransferase family protein [Candidatus Hypogeohydataceae bacterium YC41]
MVELILTVFIVYIAPFPIWLILLHILAKKEIKFPLLLWFYLSIGIVWLIGLYLAFTLQDVLFSSRFKTNIFLQGIGFLFLIIALIIEWQSAKVMGLKRLICLTELQQTGSPDKLVTTGIYYYARHPRYIEYPLLPLGFALIFGYKFLLVFSFYLFVGYTIASYFEDAELLNRFGEAYSKYQKEVPRFFISF